MRVPTHPWHGRWILRNLRTSPKTNYSLMSQRNISIISYQGRCQPVSKSTWSSHYFLVFKWRLWEGSHCRQHVAGSTKKGSGTWFTRTLHLDFTHTDTSDCLVSFFLLLLTLKPMYDKIWWLVSCTIRSRRVLAESCVQYNLMTRSCMISISEPHILRYLVLGELRSLST